MTKEIARVRIAREINDAEFMLNEALLAQAQLLTTLLVARRDVAGEHHRGHDALLRLSKSQQSLLSAGGDLARVHGRLLEINRETGDITQDCPDDWRKVGLADELITA